MRLPSAEPAPVPALAEPLASGPQPWHSSGTTTCTAQSSAHCELSSTAWSARRRVIDHLLNQVLVEGLANNRTFQRFAVWSHTKYKELHEKTKDGGPSLDTVTKVAEVGKQSWAKWRADFSEEMKKIQDEIARQKSGGRG
ncbi:hypothetical protein V8C86DRAFT_2910135, partial [Haematococcus lacustris]